MSTLGVREAIARACGGQDLTAEEMANVVGEFMDGTATPAQIGGLLVALRMKGESVARSWAPPAPCAAA